MTPSSQPASASYRQSGQIMERPENGQKPEPGADPAAAQQMRRLRLANGSEIIALPDSEETIRGFSAPQLIVVDEVAFASEDVFCKALLEPVNRLQRNVHLIKHAQRTKRLISMSNGTPKTVPEETAGQSERCPRVNHEAIENIRKYGQGRVRPGIECKFVAAAWSDHQSGNHPQVLHRGI